VEGDYAASLAVGPQSITTATSSVISNRTQQLNQCSSGGSMFILAVDWSSFFVQLRDQLSWSPVLPAVVLDRARLPVITSAQLDREHEVKVSSSPYDVVLLKLIASPSFDKLPAQYQVWLVLNCCTCEY
jgi:hypothetical protein